MPVEAPRRQAVHAHMHALVSECENGRVPGGRAHPPMCVNGAPIHCTERGPTCPTQYRAFLKESLLVTSYTTTAACAPSSRKSETVRVTSVSWNSTASVQICNSQAVIIMLPPPTHKQHLHIRDVCNPSLSHTHTHYLTKTSPPPHSTPQHAYSYGQIWTRKWSSFYPFAKII